MFRRRFLALLAGLPFAGAAARAAEGAPVAAGGNYEERTDAALTSHQCWYVRDAQWGR